MIGRFLKRHDSTLTSFILASHLIYVQAAKLSRSWERQKMSTRVSEVLHSSPKVLRKVDRESLTQWIDMTFLVVAAILLVKVNLIWSASRMLRKLKNPVRKRMGRSLNEKEIKERFAELVLTLCKGRNNRYGRMLHRIFDLFLISSTIWAFYMGELLFMDSYLALVLPLKTGSLAVIGAGALRWYEVGSIFAASFLYGGLVFLSSKGVFSISDKARRVALGIEISTIAIVFLDLIVDMFGDYYGSHSDLFSTAQGIIKGDTNKKQKARFEQIEKLVRSTKSGKRLDKQIRIWNIRRRRFLIDIVLYFTQCAAVVITFHNGGQFFNMARVVGLEIFEMISVLLLFFDESIVEPTLYVTLLEHALDVEQNPNQT